VTAQDAAKEFNMYPRVAGRIMSRQARHGLLVRRERGGTRHVYVYSPVVKA
jgi:hypothetical protein